MHRLGIQARIFAAQALVISLVISALSFLYYERTSSIIVERSQEQTRQIVLRIDTMLEQKIKEMDRIATQIAYSRDIREQFNFLNQVDNEPHMHAHVRKSLEDRLAEINAPAFSAKQINLFNMHGTVISYLNFSDFKEFTKNSSHSYQWVNRALSRSGGKLLVPPRMDEWSTNPEYVFSIARRVMTSNTGAPVIIEVQKSYSELVQAMTAIYPSALGQVHIIDRDRKWFYPLDDDTGSFIMDSIAEPVAYNTFISERSGPYVISQLTSEYTGLTIIVQQPIDEMLSGVTKLRVTTIIVAGSAALLALLVSYLLAANIIFPLKQLQRLILRLDMNSDRPVQMANLKPSTPVEIMKLHQAFGKMQDRLDHHLNEIIDSQRRESYAELQALQAQMNPHFLYNTLYSLGAYAEEEGNDQFARMCYNMTSMMRYISLPVEKPVSLQDEIAHTKAYLTLMKLRFEDRLQYSLAIDESLTDIQVPKLILQPFVENAFQHGFLNSNPPYNIEIEIQRIDAPMCWSMTIKDNGSGFQPEQLERINNWLNGMEKNQSQQLRELSQQGIGGMGVLNTFMRCRDFWKERVRFAIESSVHGTTIIMTFTEREEPPYVPTHHR
ncbi:Sensor histidine kinase YehU [compost metagenome]